MKNTIKIRERLSQFFLSLARKLGNGDKEINIEEVENYKAKKVALTLYRSKSEIKQFRKVMKLKEGMSIRHADNLLLRNTSKEIEEGIFKAIQKHSLIEYETKKEDGAFYVTGELKVYVK